MLQAIRKRIDDDKGFTLIELMVVVLIIAILIAIAIPTFLGLRARAQNRAAQSDLRNGFTAAKAWFTDDDTFAGFNADELEAIEPSLEAVDGVGAALDNGTEVPPYPVHVYGVQGDQVLLSRMSASGQVYCIAEDTTEAAGSEAGTFKGPVEPAAGNPQGCTGGW